MKIQMSVPELMMAKLSVLEDWMKEGSCSDPQLDIDPMYAAEADEFVDKVCSKCTVVEQCHDYGEGILSNQGRDSERGLVGVFGKVNYYNPIPDSDEGGD